MTITVDREEPSLPRSLPPLREDLQLHAGAPNPDGSPSWTIQDPVNNVFYRIGWLEFELLANWHLGEPLRVLEQVRRETPLDPADEELLALMEFLVVHQLVAVRNPSYTEQLIALSRRLRMSRARWLLHHYLFFRIPLMHPEMLLRSLLPWLRWIYTRSTAVAVVGLCLLGLILTGRQWDVFAAAFVDTLSPAGLVGYLLALAVAKSLHELAHALTATRYGVRVAHMGVAFIVLWPMLYTDTGESWRLHDRRQRLAIASAGIVCELALAGIATLAWNLVEQPALKQALFFLATTAWLLSLSLNASPFMRFDGYFILSDIVDLPNLHERSFALTRTWLRNLLLGLDEPYGEAMPRRRRHWLITFALLTWIYRLTVFLGIAVLVYLAFFKLLGIFLFLVEIAWFIVRPIWNELKVWQKRRQDIAGSRKRQAVLAGAVLALVALLPWNLSVTAVAWAHAEDAHVLYSPHPGRLASATEGSGLVARDAPLFTVEQPETALRGQVAELATASLDQVLAGLAGLPEGEERRAGLAQQRAMHQAEASSQEEERQRLQLRAPLAGILTDLNPELHAGVWVASQQPLGTVVAPQAWNVEAFVAQRDLDRLTLGDEVKFYPEDDPLYPVPGTVVEIDRQRLPSLPQPMLSSRFGGPVAVLAEGNGLVPRDTLYRIRIRLAHAPDRLAVRRGSVHIEAAPRSWLIEAAKSVLIVLVREATF